MRGTPQGHGTLHVGTGIIPAYAGNTNPAHTDTSSHADHPRICGEHCPSTVPGNALPGSSPHMRGTLWCRHRRQRDTGIIPAYAGNTRSAVRWSARCGDHPRICGEHLTARPSFFCLWGSSPHMRGTHMRLYQRQHDARIIPAYAGNTGLLVRPRTDRGDHPRICGEHTKRL